MRRRPLPHVLENRAHACSERMANALLIDVIAQLSAVKVKSPWNADEFPLVELFANDYALAGSPTDGWFYKLPLRREIDPVLQASDGKIYKVVNAAGIVSGVGEPLATWEDVRWKSRDSLAVPAPASARGRKPPRSSRSPSRSR